VRVARRIDSIEAHCYELLASDGGHFMLKAMRQERAGAPARAEFTALSTLHEAVLDCAEISAPEPVALFEEVDAYLMGFVPGVPLRELATTRPSAEQRIAIASLVARGLHRYYDAAGHSYADFHPGNVLYDDTSSSIYLLDPGHPSPNLHDALRWVEHGWVSSDLGYWTYHCVVNDGRHGFRNLRGRNGLAAFTSTLIAVASDEFGLPRSELAGEVADVARSHCDRLARGTYRDRTLAAISRPWFGAIARRTTGAETRARSSRA
jgi:hypothetical protein